jgi:transposase-like protein
MPKKFWRHAMTENIKSSVSNKEEFWRNHIQCCSQSDLSQERYCKEHGLALSTFSYWKRQLAKSREQKTRFFPLMLQGPPAAQKAKKASGVSLYLKDGNYRIDLSEEFSSTCLKHLISVLES